jgi:hypothetical protein
MISVKVSAFAARTTRKGEGIAQRSQRGHRLWLVAKKVFGLGRPSEKYNISELRAFS